MASKGAVVVLTLEDQRKKINVFSEGRLYVKGLD